jgi:hypothetical protein
VNLLAGLALAKIVLEFTDIARKIVRITAERAPQCIGGHRVGTRGASYSEVDTARIERLKGPELLCNDQRRMVGEHDATGTDADRRRAGGHIAHEHRGCRTGNAGHVVVLGHPVAPIPPALGVLR